jgi:hypothetical protein
MRFDRSWLPGIIVVLVLVLLQQRVLRLPWSAQAVLAIGGGLWFLWTAWNIWRNPTGGAAFGSGGRRVQYWRGQRIELAPAPRQPKIKTPPPAQLALAIAYALSGAGILAAVVGGLLRRMG